MRGMFRKWRKDEKAVAAIEAGLLFPLMVTILCGTIDTGIAVVTNQKVVNSAQVVGDLLAREEDVSDGELADAIVAGRMALQPYPTTSLGTDVAGVQFLTEDVTPTVQWRDTFNMDPNDAILDGSEGLGRENEGIIAVTVRYFYQPYFASIFVDGIQMEEIAYVRGRRGLFVTRDQD